MEKTRLTVTEFMMDQESVKSLCNDRDAGETWGELESRYGIRFSTPKSGKNAQRVYVRKNREEEMEQDKAIRLRMVIQHPIPLAKVSVAPLSFDLASTFASLPSLELDRNLKQSRVDYLVSCFKRKAVLPFRFSVCTVGNKRIRLNGQHSTSAILKMSSEEGFDFNGHQAIIEDFGTVDEDTANQIWRLIDSRHSVRTANETFISAMKETDFDDLKNLSITPEIVKTISHACSHYTGVALYDDFRKYLDTESRIWILSGFLKMDPLKEVLLSVISRLSQMHKPCVGGQEKKAFGNIPIVSAMLFTKTLPAGSDMTAGKPTSDLFWDGLITGANLIEGDIRIQLRDVLISAQKKPHNYSSFAECFATVVTCWDRWLKRKPVKIIRRIDKIPKDVDQKVSDKYLKCLKAIVEG